MFNHWMKLILKENIRFEVVELFETKKKLTVQVGFKCNSWCESDTFYLASIAIGKNLWACRICKHITQFLDASF